jgi:hypothetical protein
MTQDESGDLTPVPESQGRITNYLYDGNGDNVISASGRWPGWKNICTKAARRWPSDYNQQ